MKNIAKKIKQIVKGECKDTFGTDPNDPWSTKAGITESGGLSSYLLAKGINPKFISRDTKIAHAKSNEYLKWKKDHQFESVELIESALEQYLIAKGINPKTLTTDKKIAIAKSTAFIRWKHQHMMESIAQKDTPTELRKGALNKSKETHKEIHTNGLHKESYKVGDSVYAKHDLNSGTTRTGKVVKIEGDKVHVHHKYDDKTYVHPKSHVSDDFETINPNPYKNKVQEASTIQGTALDKFRQSAAERLKKHDDIEKKRQDDAALGKTDVSGSIERLSKALNKEEVEETDMTGKKCPCKKGSYRETGFHDDMDGVLHCTGCGKEVKRWQAYKEKPVKEETEQIDELSKDTLKSYQAKRKDSDWPKNKKSSKFQKMRSGILGANSRLSGFKPTSEDVYQDSQAATQTNFDGANAPDNTEPETPNRKKEMSKSARIIKSLYKRKGVVKEGANVAYTVHATHPDTGDKKHELDISALTKDHAKEEAEKQGYNVQKVVSTYPIKEDLYDHEKEDKSVTTYGKKPKAEKIDDKAPQAAAVLSGGKTLTGQTRDTLEIDPVMKKPTRPDVKQQDKQ